MLIHPLSVVVVAGGSRTCSSTSPYISTSARIRVSIKNTNVYRCGIIRIISYYVSSKSKKLVVVVVVICRAQCNTAYMSYMNSVCVCACVVYHHHYVHPLPLPRWYGTYHQHHGPPIRENQLPPVLPRSRHTAAVSCACETNNFNHQYIYRQTRAGPGPGWMQECWWYWMESMSEVNNAIGNGRCTWNIFLTFGHPSRIRNSSWKNVEHAPRKDVSIYRKWVFPKCLFPQSVVSHILMGTAAFSVILKEKHGKNRDKTHGTCQDRRTWLVRRRFQAKSFGSGKLSFGMSLREVCARFCFWSSYHSHKQAIEWLNWTIALAKAL